jgi:H+/Cl- antiporter ClcA
MPSVFQTAEDQDIQDNAFAIYLLRTPAGAVGIVPGLSAGRSGTRIRIGASDFSLLQKSLTALWPIQFPI